MKRMTNCQLRIVLAIVAAVFCAVGITRAANPHFVGDVTATLVGNNLQVCFKEAGLDNNQGITFEVRAIGAATYRCVNNGGQCPDAANKVVTGPVVAKGTYSSDKNGNITECLTLKAPEPPEPGELSCPNGQTMTLTDFSISNITIIDTTNSVSKTVTPSAMSATFFVCPGI
jgi:hypothetical protein